MSAKAWKRAERKGAAAIGSVRTPLSGGASRHTRSDTLSPIIYLEMKYRKVFQVVEAIRKEEVKAGKEGKVAVLGFQQRGLHTRYYLIPEPLMAILMAHLPVAVKMEYNQQQKDFPLVNPPGDKGKSKGKGRDRGSCVKTAQ